MMIALSIIVNTGDIYFVRKASIAEALVKSLNMLKFSHGEKSNVRNSN